jgi:hypothetical protein
MKEKYYKYNSTITILQCRWTHFSHDWDSGRLLKTWQRTFVLLRLFLHGIKNRCTSIEIILEYAAFLLTKNVTA